MKISILGNVIDTQNIYQIGQINGSFFLFHPYNDEVGDYRNFEIKMYNQKNLTITVPNIKFRATEEQAEDILKNNLDKLNNLRERIIKIWSENQSTIPNFEFE